jgi:hypothetical protein
LNVSTTHNKGEEERRGGDLPEPRSLEEHIFEVCVYLVMAARGLVDEEHMYGPMRLLDGASRLADIFSKSTANLRLDPFLLKVKKEIDNNFNVHMESDEKFISFIDKIVDEFTDEIKRRYAGDGQNSTSSTLE